MLKQAIVAVLMLCCLAMIGFAQDQKEIGEIKALRTEFAKATNDYKVSLAKLLTIYEGNVTRAEEKLELSRKLLAEGLISGIQVEQNQRHLAQEREKVAETKRQLENADKEIAALPSDEQLMKEYRRAQRQRPKRSTSCANWDLIARQRQTAKSITFSYTFVCR